MWIIMPTSWSVMIRGKIENVGQNQGEKSYLPYELH